MFIPSQIANSAHAASEAGTALCQGSPLPLLLGAGAGMGLCRGNASAARADSALAARGGRENTPQGNFPAGRGSLDIGTRGNTSLKAGMRCPKIGGVFLDLELLPILVLVKKTCIFHGNAFVKVQRVDFG